MSLTRGDRLARIAGDQLAVHRATTRHLTALTQLVESGIIDPKTGRKVRGITRGYCGPNDSGGIFPYSPDELLRQGIIDNTNHIIQGEMRQHKSGDARVDVIRDSQLGLNTLVTDVTGEWTPVAMWIPGAKIVKFGEVDEERGEKRARINPMDWSLDETSQRNLLSTMAINAIRARHNQLLRYLEVEELNLLLWAIKVVRRQFSDANGKPTGTPLLRHVTERLADPTDEMIVGLRQIPETLPSAQLRRRIDRERREITDLGRSMLSGLTRFVDGDLKGIADQETTPGIWEETPLLLMNCQGMEPEVAVQMYFLIEYFGRSKWARENTKYRFHNKVHDESYLLASAPGFVDSVRHDFKQSGKTATTIKVIVHHVQNLIRSSTTEAVRDLVSDCDVKISYRMNPEDLAEVAEWMRYTKSEQEIIRDLRSTDEDSFSLYKLGDRPGIQVRRRGWKHEIPLLQTRGLYYGRQAMTDMYRQDEQPAAESSTPNAA